MKNYEIEIPRERLETQISLLPGINAEVAELYFLEKKPISTIANELRISITVTHNRLAKAVFLIRKATGYAPYKNAYKILYGYRKETASVNPLLQ